MEIEEFEDLIDRHGEVPVDWPEAVRDEAVRFLASSPRAQEIVAEAAALRAAFSSSSEPRAPENLAHRIATLAGQVDDYQPPFVREHDARSRRVFRPALQNVANIPKSSLLMLALVFTFGLTLGLLGGTLNQSPHIDFATLFAVVNS
jgi:hypothetical protein